MTPLRIERIDELAKELSFQDDPDRLVRVFGKLSSLIFRHTGIVTVTRRDLEAPWYRISRSWRWNNTINPWTEAHLLPMHDRGLFGELLYGGKPEMRPVGDVSAGDPAAEHVEGMSSLICAPAYERGEVVHLVVVLRHEVDGFTQQDLETLLLNANLLGRAASNLNLTQQLQEAYRQLDHEMQQVGQTQRQLLPSVLPEIDGLELGASYITSSRAGGDYYDALPLPNGQWGLFLADVSGHGTPAAVVMAILHTLLHAYPGAPVSPNEVFAHINQHLLAVAPEGMFATAFYGVYTPSQRRLLYAVAGHPPARLRRGPHAVRGLETRPGLPLGVQGDYAWTELEVTLAPGDMLLLYTDGILEGTNVADVPFGLARLDDALRLGPPRADALVRHIERQYRSFCDGVADFDDRTLLAVVVVP